MPKPLSESTRLSEAATSSDSKSGRMKIACLSPGWGSSGYYSPEVVESAAPLFAVGTQMHLDHAAADGSGVDIYGNRSVRDIAAVLTEAATWDPGSQQLVAECQVVGPYREMLIDLGEHIGLSMQGSATDIAIGEAEGKTGPIIEGVAKVNSIDFVARAGRGGRVLQVLESARPSVVNAAAIEHGIAEATVNDTREALQNVLRDTYGGDKTYVWVRDFDDTTVWFEVESGNESGIYGQEYSQTDSGAIELVGEWVEVRVRTQYVPVDTTTTESVPAARSDSNTTTQESKEDTMPQIEEARLRELEEAAGRVPTLESERDQARGENAQLRAREGARTRARTRVAESNSELAGPVVERIVEAAMTGDLPLTESGSLDEAAFDTRVDAARTGEETYLASLNESAGNTGGKVLGFGASAEATDLSESKPTASPWGRDLSVKGA